MHCSHCGFENTEGRKFCRGCAKPLSAAPAPAPARPVVPAVPFPSPRPTLPSPTTTADVHPMAIASLALSFLAFIFPLGIASVVMGHISRKRIAESGGRLKGTGLAFAGLIISYLQLAFVALIFVIAFSLGRQLNREMDRDPYVRAALTERMLHGDPDHPSAAVMAQNVPNLMDAFHLIVAHQEEYRTKNNGNYACHLAYLEPEGPDGELAVHVRNSHYGIRVDCRGPLNDSGNVFQYTAVAYPVTEANAPNPSTYCMDETKVIRRYGDEKSLEAAMQSGAQPCPSDGEPVE